MSHCMPNCLSQEWKYLSFAFEPPSSEQFFILVAKTFWTKSFYMSGSIQCLKSFRSSQNVFRSNGVGILPTADYRPLLVYLQHKTKPQQAAKQFLFNDYDILTCRIYFDHIHSKSSYLYCCMFCFYLIYTYSTSIQGSWVQLLCLV